MTTVDPLRTVILACVDDERTLRHEAQFVDARHAETFARLARERGQCVTELERLVAHREPHDGSWTELAREAVHNVQVTVGGRNARDAILACRHSRARAEAAYDRALQQTWPEEIARVLVAQRARTHDEADELDGLQA
jgi:uncharacterized protein (TIGR02284 family)